MKTRLVVLISGRGSNMQAIVHACQQGELDADVVAVISNRPDAAGLAHARSAGIATRCIDHTNYPSRDAFDAALADAIDEFGADYVVLAGFMRILGSALVERFRDRMINIHPSLLPRYPGLDTHARALAAGDTEHGASVHFVTPELDAGPIIEQVRVPVLPGDTPESLAARVLGEEHALLIRALTRVIRDKSGSTDPRDSGHSAL